MRVVYYLRRSTEEHQVESIDTQRASAGAFTITLGDATLLPEVVDSGISRAEFVKRAGLNELRRLARDRLVDAIVTRDETRLGGEMIRTSWVIQEIVESGVRLFFYKTDEELKLDTPAQKVVMTLKNFASETERQNTSERTFEGLRRKAEQGFVAGGRCYGFDNIDVREDGRHHVEQRVNDEQAAVVVEVFELYASGVGYDGIAKRLNNRGIPSPRAGARGTGSWSAGAIRPMLLNERYLGILIYGASKKGYEKGTAVRRARPDNEVVRVVVPSLRIVSDELWASVQCRMAANSNVFGKAGGYCGHEPKYLLAAFGRCAACGGGISAMNRRSGKVNGPHYACAWQKGRGTCIVKTARPVAEVHEAVLMGVARVLDSHVISDVLAAVRRKLKERVQSTPFEETTTRARIRELERELRRLGDAIVSTNAPLETVVARVADRERELLAARARLAALGAPAGPVNADARCVDAQARSRLADLRGLFERHIPEARRALQALLGARLQFDSLITPGGPRWRVSGELAMGGSFAVTAGAAPSGPGEQTTLLI